KALDQLGKARLLRQPVALPSGVAGLTRRQALRMFGRAAALAALLPVVTSMTVPTPLQAGRTPVLTGKLCEAARCVDGCKHECDTDADCPGQRPQCETQQCKNPKCKTCTQRRCVKSESGFHKITIRL